VGLAWGHGPSAQIMRTETSVQGHSLCQICKQHIYTAGGLTRLSTYKAHPPTVVQQQLSCVSLTHAASCSVHSPDKLQFQPAWVSNQTLRTSVLWVA
jgi:hypothetical protein